jgi:hypothetical protein
VSAAFTVRELKTGAIRMASEAGVPVIPVAVWGGHRLLTKGSSSTFLRKFGVPVRFSVGAPITFASGLSSVEISEHTQKLRSGLQTLLDELQRTYPVDGAAQSWQPAHLGGTAPTPEVAAVTEAARQERKARERLEREAGTHTGGKAGRKAGTNARAKASTQSGPKATQDNGLGSPGESAKNRSH